MASRVAAEKAAREEAIRVTCAEEAASVAAVAESKAEVAAAAAADAAAKQAAAFPSQKGKSSKGKEVADGGKRGSKRGRTSGPPAPEAEAEKSGEAPVESKRARGSRSTRAR